MATQPGNVAPTPAGPTLDPAEASPAVTPPTGPPSSRSRAARLRALIADWGDVLLACWRLRERTGLRVVPTRANPTGEHRRAVVSGTWSLEVHRLEVALADTAGGLLLVVESEGRDLATAARLGLLDRAVLERALTDPSLRFGAAPAAPATDEVPSETPPESTPAGPDPSPAEPAVEPRASDVDTEPPREPAAPPEDLSAPTGSPDDVDPPSIAATLELPEALGELVDVTTIASTTGRTVRFGPDLTSRRATDLRGRPTPSNDTSPVRAERLERAVSGAAFLAVLAAVPVLLLARDVALLALVLLVSTYLIVAELAVRFPGRLAPEVWGATVGILVGLVVLLPVTLSVGGLRLPMALALPLAGAVLGAWAARSIDDPVSVIAATTRLRWTLAGSAAAGLIGLLLGQVWDR